MIGTIRPAHEQPEVAEWRPFPGEMESGGPTFVTREIDVLNVIRALDHRIPLPIGHLLFISEQANEPMLQHCKANRKRFALARTANTKGKAPAHEDNPNHASTSEPIRLGLIQKDYHFLWIKAIPWKSAECDIEVWGIPYNAIIDSGAAVLATLLRVVERAGRRKYLIMLTEKDHLVSADEEKIKTVRRMTNVAFRLGKSAHAPTLSFRIKQLNVPILNEDKWNDWWDAYLELSFCLVEVIFHWFEPAPEGEGSEVPNDEVELLIVQAWRTETEGELLGIVFGKVEEGNLALITSELLVFLAQLVDGLPLDILSRCDSKPDPDVLPRTLAPYLLWSACTELDADNCLYPSQDLYLEIDVTDLVLWDPVVRRVNARVTDDDDDDDDEEEEEEEEELDTDPDDPDYVGKEETEGEVERQEDEEEPTEEESGPEEPSNRPRRSKEEE
ncbi:hypothetical protein CBR_g8824 [Chara braunii]|uniref:Reverse transcriptase/retrotransposon-derived protein RNase H-like domain-containing protein n=1 Tax=Chara braunii TaxID=69332 RepID=A0A388KMW3_CHABU|nr:hypothetical protein CBR_g8824 [Chara braunii]|eukprot:GBG71404.1 hypothetical protein CBR_g8824 [Chara braunii]